MGATQLDSTDVTVAGTATGEQQLSVSPDPVEVRRDARVAAGLGLTGSALAIGYLARAGQTGALLDWALAILMGLLGGYWLAGLADARTPLLVADTQGVRLRLGRTWHGLPWSAVHRVEHLPRRGLLRDGRLVVVPHNTELLESELAAAAKRQVALARRLYAAPFAVPLGLTTRVVGADEDLSAALARVASDAEQIVVLTQTLAAVGTDDADQPAEETASPTPVPLRESTVGRRSEVRREVEPPEEAAPGRELRRPGRVSLVEETESWGDRVRPIARRGDPVEPIVLDDFAVEPAEDPVIGPDVRAARTRLGLTVEQLAERTRIRPHVIEAIEVDDFEPCGGDFYARGHLRTLARVLGMDVAPLLASYDERYAHAPINARRVFEAELATGASGSIRSTRGGPNWSVLVAVVMALVLCWSVARLIMDTPPELRGSTPVLNGSGGPEGAGTAALADPVRVVVSATTGGARVMVRDAAGKIVFSGSLAVGQSEELRASPPVRVDSSDGAVTVSLAGDEARPVGEPGVAGQRTFVPR